MEKKLTKPLKMILLLISSLIIATVSAATYTSLTMTSQITISSVVRFVDGDDTPSTATVHPTYCSLPLTCYPNATTTYEQAINISNTDQTNPYRIRLKHVSVSTPNNSAGNFTSITFYLVAKNGTALDSITYTPSGGTLNPSKPFTDYKNIPADTVWTIKVEVITSANASTSATCTIEMALDVQEVQ